jgi:group I intron endonuclease
MGTHIISNDKMGQDVDIKEEMTSYIYKATNLLDRMSYIGQSIEPIIRIKSHYVDKDNCYFHRALRIYGKENFEWEIIMSGPESAINDVEIGCIVFENTKIPFGYNMTDGGEGASGHVHSEETKRKIGLACMGPKHTEDHKLKMSKFFKGRIISDKTRMLISISKMGKAQSEKTKQKISETMKFSAHMRGKHHTIETKLKLHNANVGQVAWNKGLPFGELSKSKMRLSRKILHDKYTTLWIKISDNRKIRDNFSIGKHKYNYFIVCKCESCGVERSIQKHRFKSDMICLNCMSMDFNKNKR